MKINTLDFDTQALREKILDLAMRGELVPQDSNDEPVSILLNKIISAKDKLVKEKKIKKSKPLPEITNDEKPFDIPDSWKWVRLGEICLSNIGLTYKPAQKSKAITKTKILRANNIKACQLNKDNLVFLNLDSLPEKYYLRENDILMAVRSGSKRLVGKSAIVTSDFNGFSFGAFMSKIRIIRASSEYVYYFLNSNFFRSQLGDANTTTINQITQRMINSFVLPLPPLEEQKRIADKISQLFDRIGKIESASQQYTELQSSLKSRLIDVAMHGKLVKQDSTDDPASVLLDKIRSEKDELIKDKKIKKSKPLPEITEDEKPFGIPDSWEWVRVGEIISIYNGKAFKASDWSPQGLPIVRIQNLNDASATYHYYNGKVEDKFHLLGGELLFAWSGTPGTSFGAHIWKQQEAVLNQHIFKISFDERRMNKQYLAVVLNFRILSLIKEAHGSAGLRHITKKMFESTIIPIPPLNEQKRIVTKLKKLSNAL